MSECKFEYDIKTYETSCTVHHLKESATCYDDQVPF